MEGDKLFSCFQPGPIEIFGYFTNCSTVQQLQEYKATINIRSEKENHFCDNIC